jgi:hypothetical protein
MVIKSLSRKSNSGQLIKYIFRYILNPEKQKSHAEHKSNSKDEKPFIIRHNVRSKDIAGMIQEFKQNNANKIHKYSNGVSINHVIISFGPEDAEKITDKVLKDLTKKFIELRSPNSLFVGTKHTDRRHQHIHLAMSSCQLNGLSNRISKQAFADLKVALQKYQQKRYPDLIHSLPNHGKAKELKRGKQIPVIDRSNGRTSQKETLLRSLQVAFSNSKSSMQEFLNQLKTNGFEPYYRGTDNRPTGIQLPNGRKFRFNRLGFSEKLADLNSFKEKEEKELMQLQGIRSRSKGREQDRDNGRERTRDSDMERD